MTNRSKDKGTAAETAVVNYLRTRGWPHAERRALHGNTDRGDVLGIPGWVIEIKAQATYDIPGWLRETETERANARAHGGLLVVKPRGVGRQNVGDWWAIQPLSAALDILKDAQW